jgi:putative flippase GtrA
MKTLVRNTITSLFTTALDFGVLLLLVEVFHVHYVLGTFCGTVAGATSNFLINRVWSFEATNKSSHGGAHWQLVRFLPVQAGSSGLQTLGVWGFTERAHLPYLGSKLVVAVLVYILWNYPMNRWFVFRRSSPSRAAPAGTSTPAA